MRAPEGRIAVGFVRGAHGIGGEVEVRTHDPDSRALRKGTDVWLVHEDAAESRRVLAVRTGKGGFIVRFDGVETRDAADALKGYTVEVERDALPEPAPGEFYLADLIGYRVETAGGEDVGELAGARESVAQRLLVVRGSDGREVLVPAVPQILLRVEPERRVVVIDPPEGLLEL